MEALSQKLLTSWKQSEVKTYNPYKPCDVYLIYNQVQRDKNK